MGPRRRLRLVKKRKHYLAKLKRKHMMAKRPSNVTVFKKGASLADIGGAEEDRTPDLRIANATLSQLSYRPMSN